MAFLIYLSNIDGKNWDELVEVENLLIAILISRQRKMSSQNLPECAFYTKNLPVCAFSLFFLIDSDITCHQKNTDLAKFTKKHWFSEFSLFLKTVCFYFINFYTIVGVRNTLNLCFSNDFLFRSLLKKFTISNFPTLTSSPRFFSRINDKLTKLQKHIYI